MMTGRERVTAALTFSKPDRAPRDLWALPYTVLFRKDEMEKLLEEYPVDIGIAQANPNQGDTGVQRTAQTGIYTDDWGSVWRVGEPGVIGEVKQPAIADWSALEHFTPPWDRIRKRDLSHINRQCDESDRFMMSEAAANPWERLQFVRGTENTFMDVAYGTAEMRQLLEMLHEFYLEDVRWWSQSNVDAIFMADDWGTNTQLLINPKTWRELFKPLYKEYCDIIHAAGKFAFFHSDGYTAAIYDDLIEVGIDAINSQLFVMDIEELAHKYKGKITFWGEIDRQYVLPFGNPDDVRAAVRRVRRALDDGMGGVIAQCEWGKDNSYENVKTVYETWLE